MLGWAFPMSLGHDSGERVARCLVDQRGQQRGEQVDLDALAFAGALAVAQRGEDADSREQPGEHVDERDPDLLRVAVGLAGDAHQAAERLDQQVVAGQGRPPHLCRSP